MAFIVPAGKNFQVRKGNAGTVVLDTFPTRALAEDEISRLHSKHDPRSAGRGTRAARAFKSVIDEVKSMGGGTKAQQRFATNVSARRSLAAITKR